MISLVLLIRDRRNLAIPNDAPDEKRGMNFLKSYVVHLIRNAPCEGNLEGRYIGRTESPIAKKGMEDLLKLKEKHGYPKAEYFYASPSTRCVDTLKIIYPQAEPEVIFEMAECDFGDWENKTVRQLKNNPVYNKWMENGAVAAPPNGESSAAFMHRVTAGFEIMVQNIAANGQLSNVLVTSGGVIMTLLSVYGLPRAQGYDWMCESGCGYSIRIDPSLWMRSKVVEVFDTLPVSIKDGQREHSVIDIAREAAQRAYGGAAHEK